MAAGIDPRASLLSCDGCARCRVPLPKAHYFFVVCDIMDEVIRSRATTDGHLDVSALSLRFALRW